jgi:hypothetical protein
MRIGGVVVLWALETGALGKDCQYRVKCASCGCEFDLWHLQITHRERNASTTCVVCRGRVRGARQAASNLMNEGRPVCFSNAPATLREVYRVIDAVFPGGRSCRD